MYLPAHLRRQIAFSLATFGPGDRMEGVIEHIIEELAEVAEGGNDPEEWIDVVILALDGLWRSLAFHEADGLVNKEFEGNTDAIAETICGMLSDKQNKNEWRNWPDWRTQDFTKKINHVRAHPTGAGL